MEPRIRPVTRAWPALALAWLLAAPLAAQAGTAADSAARAAAADTLPATAPAVADTLIPATSSPAAPSPLSPADFDRWETLRWGTLSADGRWLAVPVGRGGGEDELRLHRLGSDSVVVIAHGSGPEFSRDGRWVRYSVGMSDERREELRRQQRPVEPTHGLLDLATGDTTVVPGVAGAAFSHDGRYLAMRRFVAGAGPDRARGADLVVRDLHTGLDTNFGNVGSFAWQDGGPLLAMTVAAAGQAGNGVRVWHPATGALRVLDSAPADYAGLRWRPASADLVVLRSWEDETRDGPGHVILVWQGLEGRTRFHTLDPVSRRDFPADTRVDPLRELDFSDDGGAVFFGVRAWARADDGEGEEEVE